MNANLLKTIALAAVVVLGMQGHAGAHAMLDHSEPRVGSEVSKPPAVLRLWFTQQLEPAFSKAQVFDAQGRQIDKKDGHLDPKDKKLLIVSLPKLGPGTYKVVWRVVSIDTHRTMGNFKFKVR